MPSISNHRRDTDQPVLSVRNLSTSFPVRRSAGRCKDGRLHAVKNVSFEIANGKTLGLVGESGCGKTTLARSITRLVASDGGQVLLLGQDILTATRARLRSLRQEMQMIFQDPLGSLNERMTVRRIIEEPLVIHSRPRVSGNGDVVSELLESVGLSPSVANRYPHEFSGGQRQRIAIARAIALRPSLLICDEPVSSLDVSVQSQILSLLKHLQGLRGMSYLFISHDLAVVRHVSHQVAVMYMGEIVEIGETASLYDDPRHPYTAALLAAVPERGPGQAPPPPPSTNSETSATDQVGCAFYPRCPLATQVCRQETPPLVAWSTTGPTHLVACHHADEAVHGHSHPAAS